MRGVCAAIVATVKAVNAAYSECVSVALVIQ
jgi:hypothetical protein